MLGFEFKSVCSGTYVFYFILYSISYFIIWGKKIKVAAHDGPIKTCHWIKSHNYSCLMTGSWDKTLKFWDLRQQQPILTLNLPERCYCADVEYPVAVVSTAARHLLVYQLENSPQEFKRIESPLKYQHRCVSIFKDKKGMPSGFALGSIEGRVAIQYINPTNPKVHKLVLSTGYASSNIFKISTGQLYIQLPSFEWN